MNILTLNKISKLGTSRFADNYIISDNIENPEGILVRSANMHEYEMPESLLAIARAGAGVNNIPVDACAEKGIVVFNTPGANANAVKELALAALLLSCRDIVAGVKWAEGLTGDDVAKQVEKGKSQFVGPEIMGKKLGVIGLGAIGVNVANAAEALGMKVYGYDPFLSIKSAWSLSHNVQMATLNEIYAECDFISIHAPLTPDTKEFINKTSIALMKDGVRILNLARGGLVHNADMAAALEEGKVAKYVTDFPDAEVLAMKNALCIPHLGASTPESEDNCAVMAVDQMKEYLENGNIVNSVNFPAVEMPRSGKVRLCIFHKNVPAILSSISATIAEDNINIANMINKSKGDFAYTVVDCDSEVSGDNIADIANIDGVIRVRAI